MGRVRTVRQLTHWIAIGACVALVLMTPVSPALSLTSQSTVLHKNKATIDNCTNVDDCPVVEVKGYTTIVFQIFGPFTGSVQFEAAVDKYTGFTPLECFSLANRSISSNSAIAPSGWRCNVIGVNFARPRIDTLDSGTVTTVAGIVSAGVT